MYFGLAADDFAFQLLDTLLELVDRQGVQVFAQQLLERLGAAER